jgi:hypothetical protein
MSKSDYLERNQDPTDPRRTAVIETFVKRAGEKLQEVIELAEELQEGTSCSFERALADALEAHNLA